MSNPANLTVSSVRLQQAAEAFLANSDQRIGKFSVADEIYWVKAVENQRWINRLQKGPAVPAFEKERSTLKQLASLGVPVPPVLADGANFFVMPDSGQSVEKIIRLQTEDQSERCQVLIKAAQALGQLHNQDLSHGRPILRDMCWDGSKITFLDLENYRADRNNSNGHARDLLSFVFSCYAMRCRELPEIDAAIAAYRAQDRGGIWDLAAAMAPRYRWLDRLTRPIQWRKYPHAREFKAIPLTLRAFAASVTGN